MQAVIACFARAVVVVLAVITASLGAQAPGLSGTAAPLDAVTTIVDAFRTHHVVALSEGHGEERGHAFRMSLIRDLRFPGAANDILVEFGNSRYQDVIDRFIGGQPVVEDELKRVWQDTTMAGTIWDRPIYEDFFRSVRAVNATLPQGRRLRVLLGDPPIDWKEMRTREDLQRASTGRSSHPADILIREVLARRRRALVLYGAAHLWRQNPSGPNLIERLERQAQEKAFVIVSHPFASLEALGVNPANWSAPSIGLTKGSSLENQLDAVLYLGPPSGETISRLSPSLCGDQRYRAMRTHRMMLAGNQSGSDVLDRECQVKR